MIRAGLLIGTLLLSHAAHALDRDTIYREAEITYSRALATAFLNKADCLERSSSQEDVKRCNAALKEDTEAAWWYLREADLAVRAGKAP